MKVKLIFAWYDLWIGLFWDQKKRWLYVFPIPCFGIVIKFKGKITLDNKEIVKPKRIEFYDCTLLSGVTKDGRCAGCGQPSQCTIRSLCKRRRNH